MTILANVRSALWKNPRGLFAAIAATTVFAGLIGTAAAVSPTIDTGRKLQSGVEIIRSNLLNGTFDVYTVPGNVNLTITDIIVGTLATTSGSYQIYTGGNSVCSVLGAARTARIVVPAQNNAIVSLGSGIGFSNGSTVCFKNTDVEALEVTIRGYLWTPG